MSVELFGQQVHNLFVGYFGRPPAPGGLEYYAGIIAAADGNYDAMLDDAVNSPEGQALYGTASPEDLVNAAFQNAFGRAPNPDPGAGLEFWVGQVTSGEVAASNLIFEIIANAQPADAAIFAAKIQVSEAIATALAGKTPEEIENYQANLAQARELLASVTAENVDEVLTTIEEQVNDLVSDPTPTLTLEEAIATVEAGDVYNIDTETVFEAGAVDVATAVSTYTQVATIIAQAQNADDLVLAELFTWSIQDTAEAILAALGEEAQAIAINGAGVVSLPDDQQLITEEQAAALQALDNFDGNFRIEGNTITLTSETDSVGPEAEDEAFRTTEFDDTIEAVASSLSSTRTLDPTDQIDGGTGTGMDTLKVAMQGNFAGFSGEGFLKNVETVQLTNDDATTRTFDASGVEGVETYNLTGRVNLADLASTDATINLKDRAAGDFQATLADDAGTALTLGLNGVGTEDNAVRLRADDITDLTLQASSASNAELNSTSFKDVTVEGAGSLELAVSSGVKTVAASALQGDLDVDLNNASNVTQVLGGEGNDIIRATTGDLTTSAEVNGGAGDDKLVLDGNVGTLQLNMSNVQTLELEGATTTFAANNVSGLETVVVKDSTTATLANLGAIGLNLNFEEASGTAVADHSGETILTVTGGTADATASSSVATNLSNTTNLTVNVAEYSELTGSVTAAKAQALNATIAGEISGTITVAEAQSVVFNHTNDDIDEETDMTLAANKATELQVTSEGTFTLGSTSQLDAVEGLTVTTAGDFTLDANLEKAAQIVLNGDGEVKLANLGNADNDFGLSLEANGLSAGFTVGTIETGSNQNVNLTVANVLGAVKMDDITVADADNGAKTGTIDLNANGSVASLTLGTLTADTVNVDAEGLLGEDGVTITNVFADEATITGSNLAQNIITVNAAEGATITGGIQKDYIAALGEGEFTVTGGLGADTFVFDASTFTSNNTLDLTAIDTITDFGTGDTIALGAGTAGFGTGTVASGFTALGSGSFAGSVAGTNALGFDSNASGIQDVVYIEDGVASFYRDNNTASGAGTGAVDFAAFTPANLQAALTLLDNNVTAEDKAVLFEFDNTTYLFQQGAATGDMFATGETGNDDIVIELQGISAEDAYAVFGVGT